MARVWEWQEKHNWNALSFSSSAPLLAFCCPVQSEQNCLESHFDSIKEMGWFQGAFQIRRLFLFPFGRTITIVTGGRHVSARSIKFCSCCVIQMIHQKSTFHMQRPARRTRLEMEGWSAPGGTVASSRPPSLRQGSLRVSTSATSTNVDASSFDYAPSRPRLDVELPARAVQRRDAAGSEPGTATQRKDADASLAAGHHH